MAASKAQATATAARERAGVRAARGATRQRRAAKARAHAAVQAQAAEEQEQQEQEEQAEHGQGSEEGGGAARGGPAAASGRSHAAGSGYLLDECEEDDLLPQEVLDALQAHGWVGGRAAGTRVDVQARVQTAWGQAHGRVGGCAAATWMGASAGRPGHGSAGAVPCAPACACTRVSHAASHAAQMCATHRPPLLAQRPALAPQHCAPRRQPGAAQQEAHVLHAHAAQQQQQAPPRKKRKRVTEVRKGPVVVAVVPAMQGRDAGERGLSSRVGWGRMVRTGSPGPAARGKQ